VPTNLTDFKSELTSTELLCLEISLARIHRGIPILPMTTATALVGVARVLGVELPPFPLSKRPALLKIPEVAALLTAAKATLEVDGIHFTNQLTGETYATDLNAAIAALEKLA
jgi:hypothetical protein